MRGTQGALVRSDRRFDAGGDVCAARAAAGRSGDGLRDRNRMEGLVAVNVRNCDTEIGAGEGQLGRWLPRAITPGTAQTLESSLA
jgi:hypothetical protein